MAHILMADIDMDCTGFTYIAMADIVMAYTVLVDTVIADIVMVISKVQTCACRQTCNGAFALALLRNVSAFDFSNATQLWPMWLWSIWSWPVWSWSV